MWFVRLVGTAVVTALVAVGFDSFAGYLEDRRKNTHGKDELDPCLRFSPMEREMRHVSLDEPFDVSPGQEVLLEDHPDHATCSFIGAVYKESLFAANGRGDVVCEFKFTDRVGTYSVSLSTSNKLLPNFYGYRFELLEVKATVPWNGDLDLADEYRVTMKVSSA